MLGCLIFISGIRHQIKKKKKILFGEKAKRPNRLNIRFKGAFYVRLKPCRCIFICPPPPTVDVFFSMFLSPFRFYGVVFTIRVSQFLKFFFQFEGYLILKFFEWFFTASYLLAVVFHSIFFLLYFFTYIYQIDPSIFSVFLSYLVYGSLPIENFFCNKIFVNDFFQISFWSGGKVRYMSHSPGITHIRLEEEEEEERARERFFVYIYVIELCSPPLAAFLIL